LLSVPCILQEALLKTRTSILDLLELLMDRIYKLTASVEKMISRLLNDFNDSSDAADHEEKAIDDDEKLEWALEMLAANRQQEIYVRFIFSIRSIMTCFVESGCDFYNGL